MDFNQLLKQPFIKDLCCSLCKNYLSYFPIHITVDDKNVCGRCELPKDVTCVRNKVYEIIAKEVTFPCRYLSEGCIEKLSPKDMADHERHCHLRVVKCPASEFDSCTESFSLPKVTKHCIDKHSYLILESGEFDVDLLTSESTNQFVIQDDDMFIFKKKFDSASSILDCTLYSPVRCKQSKEYQIDLQNGSRNLTITGYISDDPKNSKCNNICLNVLQGDKRDSMLVMGTLTIKRQEDQQESKIQVTKELSKLLKVPLCPTCSDCLTEKLKKELYFSCKNQKNGCNYVGRDVSLQEHELYCPYESRRCIFMIGENCKWAGFGKILGSHVNEKHGKYMAMSSTFTVQLGKDDSTNTYNNTSLTQVLKLSSYFFLLNFFLENECCYWTVQMISHFEKTFKYELEIVDTNGCRKLIATEVCPALTAEGQIFTDSNNNYCYFQIKQMKRMLQNDQLIFNIHIFKHFI